MKKQFEDHWNGNVGVMTYDEAIMKLGPPESTIDGEKVFVAVWRRHRTVAVAMPYFGMSVMAPLSQGLELQLNFSKDTKKLLSWTLRNL